MIPILIYLVTVNVVTFLLMLFDKRRAIKNSFRIPESVLISAALIGGSIGGILGMWLLRHKIRRSRFRSGLPFILMIHISIGFLFYVSVL